MSPDEILNHAIGKWRLKQAKMIKKQMQTCKKDWYLDLKSILK